MANCLAVKLNMIRQQSLFWAGILFLSGMLLAHPAGLIRHDASKEACIALGADSAFACVARVEEPKAGDGSGVLVDSQWVLTAAHVVTGSKLKRMRIHLGDTSYSAVKAIRHPDHKRNNVDLALIRLDRPVKGIIPASLYRGKEEVGMSGTSVGYGAFGDPFNPDKDIENEDRLAGTNMIDQIGGETSLGAFEEHFLLIDLDHPGDSSFNSLGSPEASVLEYLPIGGDSGGGLFVSDSGRYCLAGIFAEFGMRFEDGIITVYGGVGAFTRVSDFTDWIEYEIKAYDE